MFLYSEPLKIDGFHIKTGCRQSKFYLSAPCLFDIKIFSTRYDARLTRHASYTRLNAYFALTAAWAAARRAIGTRYGEQET